MKKKAFISGRSHFSLFLKNMIFQEKQLFLLIHTEEIKELQPDANISDEGLSISRDKVADSVQDVTDWAKSLDLSEE